MKVNRIFGILIFTVVEVITLVVWLVLAGLPLNGHISAVVVLFVGIFIEHYISVTVSQKRIFGGVEFE